MARSVWRGGGGAAAGLGTLLDGVVQVAAPLLGVTQLLLERGHVGGGRVEDLLLLHHHRRLLVEVRRETVDRHLELGDRLQLRRAAAAVVLLVAAELERRLARLPGRLLELLGGLGQGGVGRLKPRLRLVELELQLRLALLVLGRARPRLGQIDVEPVPLDRGLLQCGGGLRALLLPRVELLLRARGRHLGRLEGRVQLAFLRAQLLRLLIQLLRTIALVRHLLAVVLLHLRDRLDARAQVGVLLREHRVLLRERLLEHRQLGTAGSLALDERGVLPAQRGVLRAHCGVLLLQGVACRGRRRELRLQSRRARLLRLVFLGQARLPRLRLGTPLRVLRAGLLALLRVLRLRVACALHEQRVLLLSRLLRKAQRLALLLEARHLRVTLLELRLGALRTIGDLLLAQPQRVVVGLG